MTPFNWHTELGREGHRVLVAGQPFAMHCHHYNINLQMTLEETLGDDGVMLLFRSAEEAAYHNFRYLIAQYRQLKTYKSRLEMASILFQSCGLGILYFLNATPDSGAISSPASHFVTGWLAKHGRRHTPGCHFSRGWIAGVMEATFDRPLGHFRVSETQCKLKQDKECLFEARSAPDTESETR
ncbi:MAG: hypothetical protein HKM93_19025 [Desulfobacteraceae bacterium]|nr:hypothetical protein [Desulfobacteraceae bacterium]